MKKHLYRYIAFYYSPGYILGEVRGDDLAELELILKNIVQSRLKSPDQVGGYRVCQRSGPEGIDSYRTIKNKVEVFYPYSYLSKDGQK